MIDVALRLALLALVAGSALLAIRAWERHRGPQPAGLPPGLTLVTGPGCRLCEPVAAALRRAGAEPRIADVADVPLTVSSLPTALVVDAVGRVVLRRAGRSALDDARLLADRSRELVHR